MEKSFCLSKKLSDTFLKNYTFEGLPAEGALTASAKWNKKLILKINMGCQRSLPSGFSSLHFSDKKLCGANYRRERECLLMTSQGENTLLSVRAAN